jgi:ribosome-binding protein aMBF1 (putative translation factor)
MTRRQYQRSKTPPKKAPSDGRAISWVVRWIWTRINLDEWSQEDLAKKAGVSSSAMRKWRSGDRSPKLSEIEAVVNALGYELKIVEREP